MVFRGRQTLINITRPVLVVLLLLLVVVREGGRLSFERSAGDIFSRLVRRSSRPDCRVASPWMAKTGVVSDLVELSTERRMRSAVRKMDLAPSLDGGWIHMYRSVMWLLFFFLFFSFSLRVFDYYNDRSVVSHYLPLEYQFRCLLQQNFSHFVLVVPVLDIDGIMEEFEAFLFDGESVKLIADIPNKDLALVSEGV